jgi:hypothetical protein
MSLCGVITLRVAMNWRFIPSEVSNCYSVGVFKSVSSGAAVEASESATLSAKSPRGSLQWPCRLV